ncbi:MAG: capsule assembly Wzi family protein [Nitrospiraceae bacterium]|nr:capsule assembly Wzi family protein [Nitrospiraceae bacterium]
MTFKRIFQLAGLLLLIACLFSAFPIGASASTYVPVGDDAYNMLFRLEAEGLIKSGLLESLPISRVEIKRLISEAERNAAKTGPLNKEDEQDIYLLKERFGDEQAKVKYVKPLDEAYARYVYASANPRENGLNYAPAANPNGFVYNNDGDDYGKGSNLRLGFTSLADLGWFSFYINPEYRYTDTNQIDLEKIYGVLSALGFDLEIGRDSQWWGPGYNGAINLSNNADPFTMVKLTNDRPAILPWIFKYLGLTKFTFFVSQLESNRIPSNNYLWGLRLDLKPSPYVEIGLTRVALVGGEDRPGGFSAWWDSFTGQGENTGASSTDPGAQQAGGDVKITLPFKAQPAQIYFEAAGADACGIYPCRWATISGIYLPRILNFYRIDFRAEYANDHVPKDPNHWYTRDPYSVSGFTYPANKDLVIGDHMGTDSDDLFLKTDYMIPQIQGRAYVSYDREKHNLSGSPQPFQTETTLGIYLYTKNHFGLNGEYSFGKISDIPGGDQDINIFTLDVIRYF